MESYFSKFRDNTIGNNQEYCTPYGLKRMIYADWIASGRLYSPIEKKIAEEIGPYVGNTHSESSETGILMTKAYHKALKIIKTHVNAGPNDVIITSGSGMTTVINKFQRILGLKVCGKVSGKNCLDKNEKPVVFITHMEHHSNHTSWFETIADVVQINPNPNDLLVDLNEVRKQLEIYKDRKIKLGSFTACSNVTGIETPVHELAKLMHEYGGFCFIDYAASAPYVDINMNPANPQEKLDAIMFSPHKFLGGPGTSGVLIFDSKIYENKAPDSPGGGTVDWTNPWGEYKYIDDIEAREDGGTPGFIQAIKTALCIELKNQMGVANIKKRETELIDIAFNELSKINKLHILADNIRQRLGVISFYIEDIHYNLIVRLLSDRYGIQVRGGCACAGTYGHYLLHVDSDHSKRITDKINRGDLSEKPGWVRLSLHPTMTNDELYLFIKAMNEISVNYQEWSKDYIYNSHFNEFKHKTAINIDNQLNTWFAIK